MYADQTGYGFDFGSKPTGVERGGSDALHDGYVTTTGYPILFSAKVPEGNYRVTVTLGDAQGGSRNDRPHRSRTSDGGEYRHRAGEI